MKVNKEKTEDSQVVLTIELEPDEVEQSLQKSYRRLVQKVKIPGFRKGKAPRDILEQYVGKEGLLEEALNILLPEAYEKAIKEQDVKPIARPQLELVQTEPVIFKATVPLEPTISLGDYHQIRLEPEKEEVTEENVNAVIEQLRQQHANWNPVERPIALSDLVTVDVQSEVEGKPFLNRQGMQYQVLQDSNFPVPGFSQQIIGLERGAEKEFKLTLPDDYPRSEVAGKEVSFKITVTEVKEQILPELNDEFAQQVDPEYKTLDMLREKVTTALQERAEENAKASFEERVISAVVDVSKAEFPPVFVDNEIERLLNRQAQSWQMNPREFEEYLKSVNKTPDQVAEELRPLATRRVTRSLVLGKIAEEEKVEVSEDEIKADVEKVLAGAGATENKTEMENYLNSPQGREIVRQMLLAQKTVQHLVEIARSPAPEAAEQQAQTSEQQEQS